MRRVASGVLAFLMVSSSLSGCFFSTDKIDALACSDQKPCPSGKPCVGGICYADDVAPGCRRSEDCESGVCDLASGGCLPGSCADQLQSDDESDVDCGGSCSPCAAGGACNSEADCEAGVCKAGRCALPACNDGVLNGAESDVDCGAGVGCLRCADGARCEDGEQCTSGVCDDVTHTCSAPTCSDGVLNSTESSIDCGALEGPSCLPCPTGARCIVPADCVDNLCDDGLCVFATCTDGVDNGLENGLDCGGPLCDPCGFDVGDACQFGNDCLTGVCTAGKCVAPSCNDKIRNGLETDVDCGDAAGCAVCELGARCEMDEDCAGACASNICVAAGCNDLVENGDETGVDCGGSCLGCEDGGPCDEGADCLSGICEVGACIAPTCTDGAVNQSETDIDCGGPTPAPGCPRCGTGLACASDDDCESLVCAANSGTCLAPDCNDVRLNGTETDRDCGGSCPGCRTGKMCVVDEDCFGTTVCVAGVCKDHPPHCTELLAAEPSTVSGVYTIDPDGFLGPVEPFDVYCDMTTNGGGWTLVIKAHGGRTTFAYDEALWTNRNTRNPETPDLDWNQGKLESFNSVPVSEVLVSLTPIAGADRNVPPVISTTTTILISADSMHSIFNGNARSSFKGRAAWLAALPGSKLQDNCGLEGFNVRPSSNSSHSRVRVGIVGNEQDDCNTPNSYIGMGGAGTGAIYSGNRASANGGTPGNSDLEAFAVLMVRSERRSCFDLLNNGVTADGVYPVDPDGSSGPLSDINVECDMTTDGGGWTLALNYLHQGGTNPALDTRDNTLPVLGTTAVNLGDDGSTEPDSWGHGKPRLLATFNVGESRWFGKTGAHGRVIHFKEVGLDINSYIMTGGECGTSVLFVTLPDHTGLLPESLDFGQCFQGDLAMTEEPFYHDALEYWSIKGSNEISGASDRWEVDDHPNDDSQNTHHQVWIR